MKKQIMIFGDICPDNDYRKLFDKKETGAFSDEIAAKVNASELTVGNFECPATNNTISLTKCGPSLRAKPGDIQLLKNIGFDVLSLANNHILDYGMQGVYDTLHLCNDAGVRTVGSGKNQSEAAEPVIFEISGKKIGIISFAEAEFNLAGETTPGAHHFDPYDSFDQVVDLKAHSDYLIVLYHGGIEYYKNPSPLLQKKCRKFVQAGADLVLCQHSHCIGTIEEINGSIILYGQGNSVFGYREGDDTWNEGFIVTVDFQGEPAVNLQLIKATPDGIEFASEEENRARIRQLKMDSEKLNDSSWIANQWLLYCKKQEALDMPLLYGWSRVFNKLNRILGNRLINRRYSRRKLMTTMNLLRCEAHHEVVQTILEDKIL